MTLLGVAVALAVGRVDSGRARLSPPLDMVAQAISAQTGYPVALSSDFALWPGKQPDIWMLSAAALLRTGAGTIERRPYRARIRGLCGDYRAPRCWGLDAMERGQGAGPGAGPAMAPAPSRRLTGSARVLGIQRRLKALGWDPGPLDGAMGPRTRKAIRAYQQRYGLKPAGRPTGKLLDHLEVNDLFGRGLEAFKAGDFHQAARHYSQIIALRPEDGDARFNRGLVYRRMALPELAVRDYGAALALDRGHTRALFDRGNARAEMGFYGAATLDYADSLSTWLFGGSPFGRLGQELSDLSDSAARAIR
jgi:peptidoglycan hydrolase-like protein with peptidoglycan-binding domain